MRWIAHEDRAVQIASIEDRGNSAYRLLGRAAGGLEQYRAVGHSAAQRVIARDRRFARRVAFAAPAGDYQSWRELAIEQGDGVIQPRVELNQGWNKEKRQLFWFTSQGSRAIPYSLYALEQASV